MHVMLKGPRKASIVKMASRANKRFRVPSFSELEQSVDVSGRTILFSKRAVDAIQHNRKDNSRPGTPTSAKSPKPLDLLRAQFIQSQLQEEEINDSQSLLDESECSESYPADDRASSAPTAPQKGRKKSSTTSDKKKSKSVVVDKRFSLSPELVELLLRLTKQYKTKCDFNGHDFEADTQHSAQ